MEKLTEGQIALLAAQTCEKLSKEKLYGALGSKKACFMEYKGERIVLRNNRSVWKSPRDAKLSLIQYICQRVTIEDPRQVSKKRYLFASEASFVAQHLLDSGDVRIVQLSPETQEA